MMSIIEDNINQIPRQKKPHWLELLIQAVIAGAAVYQAVQREVVTFVILVAILFLLAYPFLARQWKRLKQKRREAKALELYSTDFLSYIERGQTFVQSTNQYGIPFYLRSIISRTEIKGRFFSQCVENFFARVLSNTEARAKGEFKSHSQFENVAKEFYDVMDSFVLIYVDEMIRELKKPENFKLLTSAELSGLKQRYSAVSQFVNEYNGFRSRIAKFLGNKNNLLEIRVPTETLD